MSRPGWIGTILAIGGVATVYTWTTADERISIEGIASRERIARDLAADLPESARAELTRAALAMEIPGSGPGLGTTTLVIAGLVAILGAFWLWRSP